MWETAHGSANVTLCAEVRHRWPKWVAVLCAGSVAEWWRRLGRVQEGGVERLVAALAPHVGKR